MKKTAEVSARNSWLFQKKRPCSAGVQAFLKTTLLAPHCSPYQLSLLAASFTLRYLRKFQRIAATDEPTFFIVRMGSLELVRELEVVEKARGGKRLGEN